MLSELISPLLLFKLREEPTVITGIKYQMGKIEAYHTPTVRETMGYIF